MAQLSRKLSIYSDGSVSIDSAVTPNLATHHVQGDFEVYISPFRDRYPTPAVWFFGDCSVPFTRDWQFYLVAINSGMDPRYVAALMLTDKAFFNDTGTGGGTPRRDYIRGENLDAKLYPMMTKAYVCTGARVRLTNGVVSALDGTQPPPLKPGKVYPSRVDDVNMDDYIHTPQTSPHMFYEAVTVAESGNLSPFPNGATYSWHPQPVTFMPLVTNKPLVYPPAQFARNNARLEKI